MRSDRGMPQYPQGYSFFLSEQTQWHFIRDHPHTAVWDGKQSMSGTRTCSGQSQDTHEDRTGSFGTITHVIHGISIYWDCFICLVKLTDVPRLLCQRTVETNFSSVALQVQIQQSIGQAPQNSILITRQKIWIFSSDWLELIIVICKQSINPSHWIQVLPFSQSELGAKMCDKGWRLIACRLQ